MPLPPLAFQIKGRDQSGPAFNSARRHIGDTRRAVHMLNADVKAASSQLVGLGKSALIGVTGLVGIAAAVAKMQAGLEKFDRIAKVARQNGLNGEFYQTLAFMAGEASVEVSVLDNALRKFTVGVGEAAHGTGTLYTDLNRANPELLDMILNAKTGEERLRIYADAVANASSAEEKAALVKAGFGQRGADLVRVLELSSGAMDTAAVKAAGLGNIIEQNVLDQAEEMQNRLGNAADALDKQLSAGLIKASPLLVNFYENMAAVVKTTNEWTEALGNIPDELSAIGNSSVFKNLYDALNSAGLIDQGAIDALNAKLNGGSAPAPAPATTGTPGFTTGETFGGINDTFALFKRTNEEAAKTKSAVLDVVDVFNAESLALSKLTPQIDETNKAHGRTAGALGNAHGAALDFTDSLRQAQDQGRQFNDILGGGVSGLASDLLHGVDAMDALKAAGLRVLDQLIQMTFQAKAFGNAASGFGGGGGGFLGALFSGFAGFFAGGGDIGPGKVGIAGEGGVPELITGPATVTPLANLSRGGGGALTFAPVTNIDARGSSMSPDEFDAILAERDRQLLAQVQPIVARANRVNTNPAFRGG